MDCESRAFEFPAPALTSPGVPPTLHQPMVPQDIIVWTPWRLLAAAMTALFTMSHSPVLAAAKRPRRA